MIHHGTIRKYTAALLDFFNGMEVQYETSNGTTLSRSIPITYSSKEKSNILDQHTTESILSGNLNVLPRANISLSTMMKADQRIQNKNVKINTVSKEDGTFEFMYNSVPYEFTFELTVLCRGMNEASMIIEQVAPKFNPTVNIDVWDVSNLNEPTRIPVKLLDIGIEQSEYEELSTNLVIVSFGLSIMGNLYPPIKSISEIKEVKMLIGQVYSNGDTAGLPISDSDYFARKTIIGWDVGDDGKPIEIKITPIEFYDMYPPNIIAITTTDVVGLGTSTLTAIWEDKDNKPSEITFEWVVLQGDGTFTYDNNVATLTINDYGLVEIQCTITDVFGNYSSMAKTFIVSDPNAELPVDLNTDTTAV